MIKATGTAAAIIWEQREQEETEQREKNRLESIPVYCYEIQDQGNETDYEGQMWYDVSGAYIKITKIDWNGIPPCYANEHVMQQIKDCIKEEIELNESGYISGYDLELVYDFAVFGDLPF